jgi:enoyl-CoA hydratase
VTTEDQLLLEVGERIAVITLNRPARRNALTNAMIRGLPELIAEVDARDDVDAIVVTGSDPAFCAGLDLDELAGSTENLHDGGKRYPVPPTTKPVIGAVNGAAVTGGLEIALACDFLIASDRARFADTHARVGVVGGWGASAKLPHIMGVRNALAMSLTGRFVDADEAFRLGLVTEVVPHDELMSRTRAVAAQIMANDTATVRALLPLIREAGRTTLKEALANEHEASVAWADRVTSDAIAGRRDAVFEGNAGAGR